MNRTRLWAGTPGSPTSARPWRRAWSLLTLPALLLSGVAGLAQPAHAIGGGTAATAGQFPYIARVTIPGNVCSGALIRPEWVLTAGHCVDALRPYRMQVALGGTTVATATPVAVAGARRHPDWPSQPGADPPLDLALIRLANPSAVTPVPLADPSESAAWNGPSDPLTAVGWGVTGPNTGPSNTLQTINGTVTTSTNVLTASFTSGGVCGGDSGSPALVTTPRGLVVAGALSKAPSACGSPGTYAMVGSGPGRDWLLSVMDSGPTERTEHPWTSELATSDRVCANAADRGVDTGEAELVPGITAQHTSWFNYDPPNDSTRVVVSTAGSTADTVVGVFHSTGDTLQHNLMSRWTQGDNDSQGTPQTLHAWVTQGGEPGERVYLIGVGTRTAGDTGQVCVQILPGYPLNDIPAGAVGVSGATGSQDTNVGVATGDPAEGPTAATATAWYKWTATSGVVEFSHTGGAALSVYQGDVVAANKIVGRSTEQADRDNEKNKNKNKNKKKKKGQRARAANPTFTATAGETYYIGVSGSGAVPGGDLVWKQGTTLTFDGPATGVYHEPITLQGTLTYASGTPVVGRTVAFTLGTGAAAQLCSGATDADGHATCTIDSVEQLPGTVPVSLAFSGDGEFLAATATGSLTIEKRATVLAVTGPATVANDFPATLSGTLHEDGGGPISSRTVTFTLGSGSSAQSCTGTTNGDGAASCSIATVAQPATATSVPVAAAFAGDDYYKPSNATATAKLVYYTGRATGLTSKVLVVPQVVVSDTGEVSTSVRSNTEKVGGTLSAGLVRATGVGARVNTGDANSVARSWAGELTVGLPGLPVIRATNVHALSRSTCQIGAFTATAAGDAHLGTLTIGGVARNVANIAPNTVIRAGVLTITLNEQKPVAGASAGLAVAAMRISAPGVADVVVSAAKSDIHNCS